MYGRSEIKLEKRGVLRDLGVTQKSVEEGEKVALI